jgi:hypothetical protein
MTSCRHISCEIGGRVADRRGVTAVQLDASAVAMGDASCLSASDTSPPGQLDTSSPPADDASRLAGATRRVCGWCQGPIRPSSRRDSKFCSQRCRQASHRFHRGMALRVATGRPLRLAYADPPYPGNGRLYRDHPDFAGEVDHRQLVERLVDEYPDGWALSTSAAALHDVLASCPTSVRIAAWFRGERPTPSWRPLSAWEPVIVHGGRAYLSNVDERRLDALVHVSRARTTDACRVVGAKPAAFCWWLFDLLGALPGDELVDLFPGSGGVARAWSAYASHADPHDASVQVLHDASARARGDASLADQHDGSAA